MRKSYLLLLPFICGVQLVSASLPAAAYVYLYHPGVSAVQVDTSVLGEDSSDHDQEPASEAQQADPSAETVPAAPVTPVEAAPVRHKRTKPFFAVPLADETAPVVHPPAPAAHQAAPRVMKAPLFTATAPEQPSAPPVKTVDVEPLAVNSAATEAKPPLASEADITAPTEMAAPEKIAQEKTTAPETTTAATPPVPMSPADLTLEFDATSGTLSVQAQEKLNGMMKQLQDTGEKRLEIRGFAKGDDTDQSSARRMALARALSVRSYLMGKGIKPVRLDVRALGSETDRMPIDRVDLVLEK